MEWQGHHILVNVTEISKNVRENNLLNIAMV